MKKPDPIRPLLTYAVLSFNQEKYIRDAIESAFAQTYTPLQIVISDDCSTDNTFGQIKEFAAMYSGPHEVILNRSDINLGIGAHVNRVMELARGELIVAAAGDDISVPERTSLIASKWIEMGKKAMSFHSSVIRMDVNGGNYRLYKRAYAEKATPYDVGVNGVIIGATHAWTKRIFDVFGELDENIVHEDNVIGFRSALLGGVYFIDEPLVHWREGGVSDLRSENDKISLHASYYLQCLQDCNQFLKDLNIVGNTSGSLRDTITARASDFRIINAVLSNKRPYLSLLKSASQLSLYSLKRIISALHPWIRDSYLLAQHKLRSQI